MRRTTVLVALMLVVGMLAAPAVGATTQDEQDNQTDKPDIAPGERLSGVVGVQQAEIDGEIEREAFSIALENADDNATKAGHIAEKFEENEERLDELEARQAELNEQRESGEITEGEYRAKMAQVATEVDNVEAELDQSDEAAAELPEETLEENGVNVTAIQTLKEDASELTGEEVAEIAQSIAGDERGEVDREDRGEADDHNEQRADDDQDDQQADEDRDDQRADDDRDGQQDEERTEEDADDDDEATGDDGGDDRDDDTGQP